MSEATSPARDELVRTLMVRLSHAVDDVRAIDPRELDERDRWQVSLYLSQIEEGMKR